MVYAAGRTDAGAHAEGQVVNFGFEGRIAPSRLVAALNARLPEDVAALSAEVVPDDFHARYSARWRRWDESASRPSGSVRSCGPKTGAWRRRQRLPGG